jgi:hypothetical protein
MNNKLIRNSIASLLVAILLFVVFILPAEFGIDPTGIGRLLGLSQLQAPATETETIVVRDILGGNESYREVEIPAYGQPVPLPNPDVHQEKNIAPSVETIEITLTVDQQTEIKLLLDEGQMATYEWSIDQGTIYSDFHGHEVDGGSDYWVRYREHQEGDYGSGSLVAPFSGEHGWYWLNYNEFPVTITLKVTGFYNGIKDYGLFD